MKLNSTYVLRSIDYHSNLVAKLTATANKQADMTIAFKVIGRENDGSIVILWKELKAQRLPKNQSNNSTEFDKLVAQKVQDLIKLNIRPKIKKEFFSIVNTKTENKP